MLIAVLGQLDVVANSGPVSNGPGIVLPSGATQGTMAEHDSWEATLHLAWTYVKLDYDASIQARGILDPNDPQVEKA